MFSKLTLTTLINEVKESENGTQVRLCFQLPPKSLFGGPKSDSKSLFGGCCWIHPDANWLILVQAQLLALAALCNLDGPCVVLSIRVHLSIFPPQNGACWGHFKPSIVFVSPKRCVLGLFFALKILHLVFFSGVQAQLLALAALRNLSTSRKSENMVSPKPEA